MTFSSVASISLMPKEIERNTTHQKIATVSNFFVLYFLPIFFSLLLKHNFNNFSRRMCSVYYDPILVAAAAQAQAAQQAQMAQVDPSYRLQVGITLIFCLFDQIFARIFRIFHICMYVSSYLFSFASFWLLYLIR